MNKETYKKIENYMLEMMRDSAHDSPPVQSPLVIGQGGLFIIHPIVDRKQKALKCWIGFGSAKICAWIDKETRKND